MKTVILCLLILFSATGCEMPEPGSLLPTKIVTLSPTVSVTIYPTVTPKATAVTPIVTPTGFSVTYIVNADAVYIRSISGERIGHLERGDTVACELAGEWCILDDNTRVFAGCLAPNPGGLGCREK